MEESFDDSTFLQMSDCCLRLLPTVSSRGSSVATAMHGNGESLRRMLACVVILWREVSDFLVTVGKFFVFCSDHHRSVLHL